MLVLSRLADESLIITAGEYRIKVTVLQARLGKVRLGVLADESVTIDREEVDEKKRLQRNGD